MLYTRRDLGRLAAVALPVAMQLNAKPNSKFGGVQVGAISYSFREMPDGNNAGTILPHMLELGLSGIEMMNGPAEAWAGAPTPAGRGPGGGRGRGPATAEQIAERQRAGQALKAWRLGISMGKYKELRKLYNDAGVNIYAFKLGLSKEMSDEEYDYAFNVADALGANHITMELPEDGTLTKRVGEFAAKRKIYVGYHAHTQATPALWDEALAQSKYNAINLDLGHYTAGTNASPLEFMKKNHARIVSLHMKDRKYEKNGGDNLPWGQGQTPIAEALQLMKKEKYTFPASIELEYRIPEGSTVMAEMAKCVDYCKRALA
ncbi:MAG: sugar phosphate isomerase/epimerase [Bryobacterales bacterium]|nr:sugar phosphate isomerase/epimerase [Bryobacterales bacterium]